MTNGEASPLGTRIEIASGGATLPAYCATPGSTQAGTPAIVLAMHLWGVDASMRAAAERFARAGFVALVPDLYAGLGAPDGDGVSEPATFVPFARRLEPAGIDAHLSSSVAWLRERHPQAMVGLAGFCMGGRIATARAVGYGATFRAIAAWYGLAEIEGEAVDVPLVASYGAADHGIPVERVRAFERGLRPAHDIEIYEGAGHAFADERREAYEPRAAEDSWLRTLRFLRAHLTA